MPRRGVDIPSVTHALILASSKNPREFIQRRGRVLRTHPGKALAHVHDAIVLPPRRPLRDADAEADPVTAGELARAIEFAQGRTTRAPAIISARSPSTPASTTRRSRKRGLRRVMTTEPGDLIAHVLACTRRRPTRPSRTGLPEGCREVGRDGGDRGGSDARDAAMCAAIEAAVATFSGARSMPPLRRALLD